MKTKTDIKKKVAAKVAKAKSKIARKTGKAKACAVLTLAALSAALIGCMGTSTPSRSQTLTFDRCTFSFYGGGDGTTNDVARVEIGTQGMSIENSGTETQTATPTQTTDVKPDLDLSYGGRGAGLLETALGKLGGGSAGAASDAPSCPGGNCSDAPSCADGDCDR